jgi:hypothetical protein
MDVGCPNHCAKAVWAAVASLVRDHRAERSTSPAECHFIPVSFMVRTVNSGRINQILTICFRVTRGGLNYFPSREIGTSSLFGNGRSFSLVFGLVRELVLALIGRGIAQRHATTTGVAGNAFGR